ncbi:hypothetical protein MRX96_041782 [Rhipicephalus microplus]
MPACIRSDDSSSDSGMAGPASQCTQLRRTSGRCSTAVLSDASSTLSPSLGIYGRCHGNGHWLPPGNGALELIDDTTSLGARRRGEAGSGRRRCRSG